MDGRQELRERAMLAARPCGALKAQREKRKEKETR
jgi:hypothetical protein